MSTPIIADESVDFAIIQLLRDAGIAVSAIVEEHPGWPDEKVLDLAFRSNAYLITEDKDFGELTYRFRRPNHGILLVRMIASSSERKAFAVLDVVQRHFDRLQNTFAVLEEAKLRIKPN